MATVTSVKSGNWNVTSTWNTGTVPVNGDSVVISEGHEVCFNVDQSGFVNGLASLEINGILYWKSSVVSCLKMNGNITGTGRLYVAEMYEMDPAAYEYAPVEGYPNVWRDYGIAAIETLDGVLFTSVDSIAEVNETPNSIFQTWEEGTYITYWNDAEPTNRYFNGINMPPDGSEYRCLLLFNSTGTINIPNIQMYGEFYEREYTQLAANASSGQNQIILEDDMEFQQGDIIAIGSGNEDGVSVEAAACVYTVSAYNYDTKTVTLTDNLGTARLIGDYVARINRPIKVARSSGTGGIIQTSINGIVLKGVLTTGYFIRLLTPFKSYVNETFISHCSQRGVGNILRNGINTRMEDCTVTGGYFLSATMNSSVKRCININPASIGAVAWLTGGVLEDCIIQNGEYGLETIQAMGSIVQNSVLKNLRYLTYGTGTKFVNCEFDGKDDWEMDIIFEEEFVDCVFKSNQNGWLAAFCGKLTNCLFEGETEINYTTPNRAKTAIIESFDHNQLPGNYKAWMRGGHIETAMDGPTPLPGRLILHCESTDYPLFRDFPVTLVAYRNMWWWASVLKDFTGGEVKMELIDPTADPLVDPSAQPLASYTLEDVKDVLTALKLNYRSNRNMQAILRVSAQNSTGTVQVNTRLIEKRIKYGR